MINIYTSHRYKIPRKELTQFTLGVLSKYGVPETVDLNLIFVGKRKMKDIALEYKQEDVALPVLSFEFNQEEEDGRKLLGEVYLCYPQVVLLAAERNKTVDRMVEMMVEHGIQNLVQG